MIMESSENWKEIELKLIHDVINKRSSSKDSVSNNVDECGMTLLHLSCQTGMINLCKCLLEQSEIDVNKKDMYKRTPLMLAAYFGFRAIVDLLISHGAILNDADEYGFNASFYAIYSGDINIYKTLSSFHESDVVADTYLGRISSLALASALGKNTIVEYILQRRPDLLNVEIGHTGVTPLILAYCGNYPEIIKQLNKTGADIPENSLKKYSSISKVKKKSAHLSPLDIPKRLLGDDLKSPLKRKAHPLTPNIYISPIKKASSPLKALDWIRMSMSRRRSRSAEGKRKENIKNDTDSENVLKSVFQMSKMEQYWSLFHEQEITFNTFLTMNENDLISVGISKSSARLKFLSLIEHYRKIFNSQ